MKSHVLLIAIFQGVFGDANIELLLNQPCPFFNPLFSNKRCVTIRNNCDRPMFPIVAGHTATGPMEYNSLVIVNGNYSSFSYNKAWTYMKVWVRDGCEITCDNPYCVCKTGSACREGYNCSSAEPLEPVTVAEMWPIQNNFGLGEKYGVNMRHGLNVQMSLFPSLIGSPKFENMNAVPTDGNCEKVGCQNNLAFNCPEELRYINNGTSGCRHLCNAFPSDEFCCTGAYGTADTCFNTMNTTNYRDAIKKSCLSTSLTPFDPYASCNFIPYPIYIIDLC